MILIKHIGKVHRQGAHYFCRSLVEILLYNTMVRDDRCNVVIYSLYGLKDT